MKQINYIIAALIFCFSINLSAQPINELLVEASKNNPLLAAFQLEYEAAQLKAGQQRQLQDPQLTLAFPILPPETRLGAQVFSIGAKQMFPWFGTLKAKEEVLLSLSKAKYEQVTIERLQLFYQIKSAYYKLCLIREKQKIIKENIRLFSTLENVSLAKVENGESIASDVLKVQLINKTLENELLLLDNEKSKLNSILNPLINGSSSDNIEPTEQFNEVAILDFNLSEYATKIEANHPLISQLNWQIIASEKKQELNRLSGLPSFGIGLDYTTVLQRTDASPDYNGRDILIPKISLSLPIYRNKYRLKQQEEALLQKAIEYKKESISDAIISQLLQYKSDYDHSLLRLKLLEQQLTLANSAYAILLSEYSGKSYRFDELIRIQDQILSYKLKIIKAVIDSHEAVAKIDRFIDW